jgi:hypothetical protein
VLELLKAVQAGQRVRLQQAVEKIPGSGLQDVIPERCWRQDARAADMAALQQASPAIVSVVTRFDVPMIT